MPGMNSGLYPASPTLVAAFRAALLHQLMIISAVSLLLVLGYIALLRGRSADARKARPAEPAGRDLLRLGFGCLWLVDGALQLQPGMPGGLPAQVIAPGAASSPSWVRRLVSDGITIWSHHPVQAASAAVWIQIGLGLWLLLAIDGWWSRLGGLASVCWGLMVWVLGEAFGGIFGSGLSLLTGAPGAVALYVVAGALIALPEPAWAGVGRLLIAGIGVFWMGMAVLQAWPGRGFWTGALAAMARTMARTQQPAPLAHLVSGFANLSGLVLNLIAVVTLAVLGAAFGYGRPPVLRFSLLAATVFCLLDWVLVQDLGLFGGFGTDPNSMLPWLVLLWSGYRAVQITDRGA